MVHTTSGCDVLLNVVKSDKYTLSKISLELESEHTIKTRTFKSGRRTNIIKDSERFNRETSCGGVISLTLIVWASWTLFKTNDV